MNYSQDRRRYDNLNDYNNTLAMNRSLSNNRYSPNNNNPNNMMPLSINANNLNNNFNNNYNSNTIRQQRCETETWDKTKGPYGVRFDEMEAHAKLGQKQYNYDKKLIKHLTNNFLVNF